MGTVVKAFKALADSMKIDPEFVEADGSKSLAIVVDATARLLDLADGDDTDKARQVFEWLINGAALLLSGIQDDVAIFDIAEGARMRLVDKACSFQSAMERAVNKNAAW